MEDPDHWTKPVGPFPIPKDGDVFSEKWYQTRGKNLDIEELNLACSFIF